jgi:hypothetical protein
MMKPILVEQIPNTLINNRTLKLLHFLTTCWDCIHLSTVGYVCVCVCVCVSVYIYIYIYLYNTVLCKGSGPREIGGKPD